MVGPFQVECLKLLLNCSSFAKPQNKTMSLRCRQARAETSADMPEFRNAVVLPHPGAELLHRSVETGATDAITPFVGLTG